MRISGIARLARVGTIAVFGTVALVLAGCGGGGGGVSNLTALAAEQVLAKVGEESARAQSASLAMEMSGTGEFAFEASGSGKYTTSPEYAAEFSFDSMSAAGQSLPGGMEIRIVGTATYLRMPGLGDALGAEWMTFDLSEMDDLGGLDFGDLTQQQQLVDPRAQLAVLVNSGDATEVGEEEIDGVDTVHYRGTVDPGRIAELQGLDESAQEAIRQAFEDLQVRSIEYDLWVDNDFHARKMAIVMEADAGTMNITITQTDFGKPVTVEAPSNAVDLGTLLENGAGG